MTRKTKTGVSAGRLALATPWFLFAASAYVAGAGLLAVPGAATGLGVLVVHRWWLLAAAVVGIVVSGVAFLIFLLGPSPTAIEPVYASVALAISQPAFVIAVIAGLTAFVMAVVELGRKEIDHTA